MSTRRLREGEVRRYSDRGNGRLSLFISGHATARVRTRCHHLSVSSTTEADEQKPLFHSLSFHSTY